MNPVMQQQTEPHEYSHRGLFLVDLPGCGTPDFPTDKYVKQLKLDTYDFFILATDLRFSHDDEKVFEQVTKDLKKPCYIVRTKFDQAIAHAKHDGLYVSDQQLRQRIEQDVQHNLPHAKITKVYMLSSWYPTQFDLPMLLEDILLGFRGLKAERLTAAFGAWNEPLLDRNGA